jgi:urease subunit alpha
MFGPQAGDVIRLGGTTLRLRIPERVADQGSEFHIGFAKTGRDAIALAPVSTRDSADVVINNVIVMDPVDGIRVASIGIREGRISGIGKAGNPNTTDNVDIVVGSGTVVLDGEESLIATPGGIDTHAHAMTPRMLDAEISSGVTTVLVQETGPVWGVGIDSPWYLGVGYQALDYHPINIGVMGRASSARPGPLMDAIDSHVCGFKIHEDTGATIATIDQALRVADECDVQIAIHTDSLNETLSVADTMAVCDGRTIHAFHVEGCGGGHAPDVLTLAGHNNILASSTNPTLPYGVNAVDEHMDMILLVHGMDIHSDADARIAKARVRGVTMAAENHLHNLGVIPMTSSDAQGLGRTGETWSRTFATAAIMADPDTADDNEQLLRYLAKITINPALTHGIGHEVGRLAPGYIADIVLWSPGQFAAKPSLIFKSGFPTWGQTGDPNASAMGSQPLQIREQFGALGQAPAELSYLITNKQAAESGAPSRRKLLPVTGTRTITASDMVRHGVLGDVTVAPDGSAVFFNGKNLSGLPVHHAPLSRLHFW